MTSLSLHCAQVLLSGHGGCRSTEGRQPLDTRRNTLPREDGMRAQVEARLHKPDDCCSEHEHGHSQAGAMAVDADAGAVAAVTQDWGPNASVLCFTQEGANSCDKKTLDYLRLGMGLTSLSSGGRCRGRSDCCRHCCLGWYH